MKSLLTIFTLVFTLIFSSTSFSEWTKVDSSIKGDTFYVDLERIRKHDGFVYFWSLVDYIKPSKSGVLSGKVYHQSDCKLFRVKDLSFFSHKEPMGRGTGKSFTPPEKWIYPVPESMREEVLKKVCSR